MKMTARRNCVTGRKLFYSALAILVAGLCFGCGEQDLYEPPESPYSPAGRVPLVAEASGVAILGNYAYVSAGQAGFYVVDISDPRSPTVVSSYDTEKRADAVAVARTYEPTGDVRDIAFLIEGTEGIVTFDITDPSSIIDFGEGTTAVDGKGLCVVPAAVIGDPYLVYLADSWKGVRVFWSIPEVPGRLDYRAFVNTHGYTQALDVVAGYAYVAEDEMGVTCIDVTNIRTGGLVVVDSCDTPGNAMDIAVVGNYVYVADGDHGLHVMEIDGEHHLTRVATLQLNGECVAIDVRENIAYIAAEDAGVHMVGISDPYHPVYLGSNASEEAVDVAVSAYNVVCVADAEEGLLLYTGVIIPPDVTEPAAISDLEAVALDLTLVNLSWTAPGDDGMEGTALVYEIRTSNEPITEETWESAERIIKRPIPQEAGTPQSVDVSSLTPGQTYYFAIKTRDDEGNWSDLSNVVSVTLSSGALSEIAVAPSVGEAGVTEFEFSVIYIDDEGLAPANSVVVIDGEEFDLPPDDPQGNYSEGVRHSYATILAYGVHEFQFRFTRINGLVVSSRVQNAPDVRDGDPTELEMITLDVEGGTPFTMGSPSSELGREPGDEQQHEVTLTRNFAISATEISQALYEEVTGTTSPAYWVGATRPVDNVTWYDAVAFCNALSARDGFDPAYTISQEEYREGHLWRAAVSWDPAANGYRLPTEAEWEFACRAGTETALFNGNLSQVGGGFDPLLDEVGWYWGNADFGLGPKSRSVALKDPNPFGLYDTHGNLQEWCWDWYGPYPTSPVTHPTGPEEGIRRVCRGGSWYYFARDCRSAARRMVYPSSRDDTIGFRVVRNAE